MKPEDMIQARNKARKEWLKSMHLRPVYLVEEDGGMTVGEKTGELQVYIAVAIEATGARGNGRGSFLQLHSVNPDRRGFQSLRKITYQNRGILFPWDDLETATEICFKSKVAEKREELKNTYGEWKDEED